MNNNLMVVIDAGHGGADPGAVSGNVKEKDLTLMISKYMYDQFKNKGIPVVLVRGNDETLNPDERVKRILNAYGNKNNVVVISNHINSATNNTAEGAEVIYALRNNDKLSKNIVQSLSNEGQVVRSYYQRRLPSDTSKDFYFIHRDTGVTEPIIVEYGFINNPTDLARIQNNYKKYVDAVVNAVIATKGGVVIAPTPGEGITYIVKSGDSLYKIANNYNTTISAIKALNNLTSDNLSIGQILKLPYNTNPTPGTGITYIVKSGDSLYKIANNYNTTVSAIKALNNLASDNLSIGQKLQIPTKVEIPSNITYIVKSGDSLYKIANNYNTTVSAIKSLNNLTSDNLAIGQVLKIPTTEKPNTKTYIVKSGDSLYKIANNYNTTVSAIKALNKLTSDNLAIGQVLQIP